MRGNGRYNQGCVMLFAGNKVNEAAVKESAQPDDVVEPPIEAQRNTEAPAENKRWLVFFAVPVTIVTALALHWFAARQEPPGETHLYTCLLSGLLVASIVAVALQ